MQTLHAEVVAISPLTEFVHKVILKPAQSVTFEAGQYLQVVLGEKDKRAFSIASRPSQCDQLELHIGASAADSYAMQTLEHLRAAHADKSLVTIEAGLGISQLRIQCERPIILLAGGTGFSYVKSMADHLSEIGCDRPVLFYWGVREESALYAHSEMQAWADSRENFTFIPVVENPTDSWTGHTGYVHKAVMQDIVSLAPYDIYMAGRFDMIGIVRDDFLAHGAIRENMYADAFAFIK
ncbi:MULTISPECIES: NAD(P)H-flavin reductase [Pseudoalteromonas]|uniref:NAD(P)H-flavin reductase n=1 Tax=Pseudoalteromonas haloplanktis TaxID=228 RepID=A0ABU1BCJ0_PSEHA|nr:MULTISPECIES: NAD(P)H-flavin reductase [Pseudoalteromonas]MCF6144497.1 aquacobalamin reductase / NAD(P)H-flavin reductase [Pseudoalteromonas mariniglutinosa NCIMB 1770]MDQ9092243.1 NAD(P)H-flavin reductase [Pseudoalteromonas haloplanktis]TMN71847.1 NAD(P)H-flavin reductase [Pseudoalteromonas sp. S1727]BDF96187.1 NAD(P)H-flavin reductase [Pseudoalteromonas sp. KAN5]